MCLRNNRFQIVFKKLRLTVDPDKGESCEAWKNFLNVLAGFGLEVDRNGVLEVDDNSVRLETRRLFDQVEPVARRVERDERSFFSFHGLSPNAGRFSGGQLDDAVPGQFLEVFLGQAKTSR